LAGGRLVAEVPAAIFEALAPAGIDTVRALFAGGLVDTLLAFADEVRRDIPAADIDGSGAAGGERIPLWKAIRQAACAILAAQPQPWHDDASGAVVLDVGRRSVEVVELAGEFRGFGTLEDYDAADRFSLNADDAARLRGFEELCRRAPAD
jgi:hypothetical protein